MYRGKFWNRQTRDEERSKKRNKWFAKGDFETVLFMDATPRSELAKECRNIMKEAELKIRVVERSGKPLKRYLARSDPFKTPNCENEECRARPGCGGGMYHFCAEFIGLPFLDSPSIGYYESCW